MDSLSRRQQTKRNNPAGDPFSWEATSPDEDLDFRSWDLFDSFFLSPRPAFSLSRKVWNPPVDISEAADCILIRMEIAGIRPDDLSVTFEQGVLIIRGRRYERAPGEKEMFHLMEIHHGPFERAFRLSRNIVEDEIKAYYHDGFLDIEIPKGKPKGNSVKINVRES